MFLQPGALNAHALLSGSTLPAARSWPRNLELRRQLLASGADLRKHETRFRMEDVEMSRISTVDADAVDRVDRVDMCRPCRRWRKSGLMCTEAAMLLWLPQSCQWHLVELGRSRCGVSAADRN